MSAYKTKILCGNHCSPKPCLWVKDLCRSDFSSIVRPFWSSRATPLWGRAKLTLTLCLGPNWKESWVMNTLARKPPITLRWNSDPIDLAKMLPNKSSRSQVLCQILCDLLRWQNVWLFEIWNNLCKEPRFGDSSLASRSSLPWVRMWVPDSLGRVVLRRQDTVYLWIIWQSKNERFQENAWGCFLKRHKLHDVPSLLHLFTMFTGNTSKGWQTGLKSAAFRNA